jgi:acetyl-CoA C-acetyltransferase
MCDSTAATETVEPPNQVTGAAGPYQVPGARTGATLNIGGSFSTIASFVLTSDEEDRPA